MHSMIKLYHGSNVGIESIDLSLSKKGKDFGQGFYLNPNKTQAFGMAQRVALTRDMGKPTVTIFEFDESWLHSDGIEVKVFEDYTPEWAEFVLMNRNNQSDSSAHHYDIVVGPIADDTVGVQLRRFMIGYISIDVLVEELRFHGNHAIQYFFGTDKAVSLLRMIGYEQ